MGKFEYSKSFKILHAIIQSHSKIVINKPYVHTERWYLLLLGGVFWGMLPFDQSIPRPIIMYYVAAPFKIDFFLTSILTFLWAWLTFMSGLCKFKPIVWIEFIVLFRTGVPYSGREFFHHKSIQKKIVSQKCTNHRNIAYVRLPKKGR